MKFKPTTRQFIASAGAVVLVMIGFVASTLTRMDRAVGGYLNAPMILIEAAFYSVPLVLGIAFAWWRLQRDRKARARRKAPLSL